MTPHPHPNDDKDYNPEIEEIQDRKIFEQIGIPDNEEYERWYMLSEGGFFGNQHL